jgi:hypothetical protein
MLPTFIIAGATKSGTTSLWEYLNSHPEVCMAGIKEPCFFTQERIESTFSNGMDWYKNLFSGCSDAKAVGEASTVYMIREDSATLIHQFLPDVRLIFLLRDPVERLYSQYWSQQLLEGIRLGNFPDMLKERHPFIEEILYNSRYDHHLNRFFKFFDQDQISVLLFDDLKNSPGPLLREIYATVGVDSNFTPPNIGNLYNPARMAKSPTLQKWMWKLNWAVMKINLRPWQYGILKKIRNVIFRFTTQEKEQNPIPAEVRRELIKELAKTIEFVENYLDRPLPEWRQS